MNDQMIKLEGKMGKKEIIEAIERLRGCLPDEGKTLEDYRAERIETKYGTPIPKDKLNDSELSMKKEERNATVEEVQELSDKSSQKYNDALKALAENLRRAEERASREGWIDADEFDREMGITTKKSLSLKDLFDGYEGTDEIGEIDWGNDIGNEVISDES